MKKTWPGKAIESEGAGDDKVREEEQYLHIPELAGQISGVQGKPAFVKPQA